MAIVKMKRLGLLAMREDREAILHALQGLGCVEISEPTLGPQGDEDAAPAEQLLASLFRRIHGPLPMRRRATTMHSAPWKCCGMMARKGAVFFRRSPAPAGTSCMPRRQWHSRTRLLPT